MSNLIIMNNNYKTDESLERLLAYILRIPPFHHLKKSRVFCDGNGVDTTSLKRMIKSFNEINTVFNHYMKRRLHHFVITAYYPYHCINHSKYKESMRKKRQMEESWSSLIAISLSSYLCDVEGFQNVYAIHYDKEHIHIHFIMNSINYRTGIGLSNERTFYYCLLDYCQNNFSELPWEGYLNYKEGDEPYND